MATAAPSAVDLGCAVQIIDSAFMMASIITGEPDPEDVRKYFRAPL